MQKAKNMFGYKSLKIVFSIKQIFRFVKINKKEMCENLRFLFLFKELMFAWNCEKHILPIFKYC